MENKLAALFAIMGMMILVGTWCLRSVMGLGVMEPEKMLFYALAGLLGGFTFGKLIARVSIALVDEIISDMRSREARYRASLADPLKAPLPDATQEEAAAPLPPAMEEKPAAKPPVAAKADRKAAPAKGA